MKHKLGWTSCPVWIVIGLCTLEYTFQVIHKYYVSSFSCFQSMEHILHAHLLSWQLSVAKLWYVKYALLLGWCCRLTNCLYDISTWRPTLPAFSSSANGKATIAWSSIFAKKCSLENPKNDTYIYIYICLLIPKSLLCMSMESICAHRLSTKKCVKSNGPQSGASWSGIPRPERFRTLMLWGRTNTTLTCASTTKSMRMTRMWTGASSEKSRPAKRPHHSF